MTANSNYNKKFPPHGRFDISLENDILIIDAIGPFNEQAVYEYEANLSQFYKQLTGTKWYQITMVHGLSLGTVIAENQLIESIQLRKGIGLQAAAVVFDDVEGLSMMKTQLGRCYFQSGVPYNFFADVSSARSWLMDQMQ